MAKPLREIIPLDEGEKWERWKRAWRQTDRDADEHIRGNQPWWRSVPRIRDIPGRMVRAARHPSGKLAVAGHYVGAAAGSAALASLMRAAFPDYVGGLIHSNAHIYMGAAAGMAGLAGAQKLYRVHKKYKELGQPREPLPPAPTIPHHLQAQPVGLTHTQWPKKKTKPRRASAKPRTKANTRTTKLK